MRYLPEFSHRLALNDRDGFALPAVLFVMVVMTIMSVALVQTSMDEAGASNAVRQSGGAFNAAESGADQIRATWDADSWDTLTAGNRITLAWATLPENGSTYRATVLRTDTDTTGTQDWYYLLTVTGRDNLGAQRVIQHSLVWPLSSVLGAGTAAAVIRGDVTVLHTGMGPSSLIGQDGDPADWGGYCSSEKFNR